jgi:hypothetical protein
MLHSWLFVDSEHISAMSTLALALLTLALQARGAYYNASAEYSSGALGSSPAQSFVSTDLTP